jgi:hypothetical protein
LELPIRENAMSNICGNCKKEYPVINYLDISDEFGLCDNCLGQTMKNIKLVNNTGVDIREYEHALRLAIKSGRISDPLVDVFSWIIEKQNNELVVIVSFT